MPNWAATGRIWRSSCAGRESLLPAGAGAPSDSSRSGTVWHPTQSDKLRNRFHFVANDVKVMQSIYAIGFLQAFIEHGKPRPLSSIATIREHLSAIRLWRSRR